MIDASTAADIQQHVDEVLAQAEPWLENCPSCDSGLPKQCICPAGNDYRNVMLAMAYEIARLRTFVVVAE